MFKCFRHGQLTSRPRLILLDIVSELAKTEGKKILLQNTDKAVAEGAFGLPWFICTDSEGKTEHFWGCDRLPYIAEFLDLDKPAMQRWKSAL